jgi:hypothetical protein
LEASGTFLGRKRFLAPFLAHPFLPQVDPAKVIHVLGGESDEPSRLHFAFGSFFSAAFFTVALVFGFGLIRLMRI